LASIVDLRVSGNLAVFLMFWIVVDRCYF